MIRVLRGNACNGCVHMELTQLFPQLHLYPSLRQWIITVLCLEICWKMRAVSYEVTALYYFADGEFWETHIIVLASCCCMFVFLRDF